jgi:ABC-type amino acid transport substrate-binding protein
LLIFFPNAIGLRQPGALLKEQLDSWAVKNTENGKLGEIHAKWMKNPLNIDGLKKFQRFSTTELRDGASP